MRPRPLLPSLFVTFAVAGAVALAVTAYRSTAPRPVMFWDGVARSTGRGIGGTMVAPSVWTVPAEWSAAGAVGLLFRAAARSADHGRAAAG